MSLQKVAAVAVFGALAAPAEWPHIERKLQKGHAPIAKVLVLPAVFEAHKSTFHGWEPLEDTAVQIADGVSDVIARELRARGVEILPIRLHPAQDRAAKYAIADLQSRYDVVAKLIRKDLGGVDKGRFTLTDKVAAFSSGLSADALVFIRGTGEVGSRLPKDPLKGRVSLRCDVSLVDPQSGEVMAFLRFSKAMVRLGMYGSSIEQRVREALRDVPFPITAPKK